MTGIFYGVGFDYAVTDRMTVGAELLQHEFDNFDGTGLDVDALTFGVNAALRF
jgi:outer membrane immunogenic protein